MKEKLPIIFLLHFLIASHQFSLSQTQNFSNSSTIYNGYNYTNFNPAFIADENIIFNVTLPKVNIDYTGNIISTLINKPALNYFSSIEKSINDENTSSLAGISNTLSSNPDILNFLTENYNTSIMSDISFGVSGKLSKSFYGGVFIQNTTYINIPHITLGYTSQLINYIQSIERFNMNITSNTEGETTDISSDVLDLPIFEAKTNGFAANYSQIGISLAYGFYRNKAYALEAGITAKYVTGGTLYELENENFRYDLDISADSVFISNQGSYRLSYLPDFNPSFNGILFNSNTSGMNFDVGFTISKLRTSQNSKYSKGYKWKAGLSLLNIGEIHFRNIKQIQYTGNAENRKKDLQTYFDGVQNIIDRELELSNVASLQLSFSDIGISVDTSIVTKSFSTPLATFLNVDYNIWGNFYANGYALINLNETPISNQLSVFGITPRYEKKSYQFDMPITYIPNLSVARVGLGIRLGYISFGVNDIINTISSGLSAEHQNIYFGINAWMFRKSKKQQVKEPAPIPPDIDNANTSGDDKDFDKDGVADSEDLCPKIKGESRFSGCPEIGQNMNELCVLASDKFMFEGDNSYYIKPESFASLNRLIDSLKKNPSVYIYFELNEKNALNQDIRPNVMQERATRISNYTKERGINGERIKVTTTPSSSTYQLKIAVKQ